MSDRIKLAEAMGWQSLCDDPTKNLRWELPDGMTIYRAFDPFTDANDDYAVLEHFRCRLGGWDAFKDELAYVHYKEHGVFARNAYNYKIGDYARAALKVIDKEPVNGG